MNAKNKKIKDIFIVPSSIDGILSALYYSFVSKILPEKIINNKIVQQSIEYRPHEVCATNEQIERVKKAILKYAGKSFFDDSALCFLSNDENVLDTIFKYGYEILEKRTDISHDYTSDNVYRFNSLVQKVISEKEKCAKYLQFSKNNCGILQASIKPSCDILEISIPLLIKRLHGEKFIIKDELRNKLALFDGSKFFIAIKTTKQCEYICLEQEKFYEKLNAFS